MKKDDLLRLSRRFVDKWQPILNIRDWHINIELCETSDEMKLGGYAECSAHTDLMRATIRINNHRHCREDLRELEESVVHEMLHVATDAWGCLIESALVDPSHRKTQLSLLEKTIEGLARGLVDKFGEPNRKLR